MITLIALSYMYRYAVYITFPFCCVKYSYFVYPVTQFSTVFFICLLTMYFHSILTLVCRESVDPSSEQENCLHWHQFLYYVVHSLVIFLELWHCTCSHFIFEVTDDIINNKESSATYLTNLFWIHLLLLQTIFNELI